MNFATWSMRNPIPVVLLFFLLVLAGWRGFSQLPIQNLPDLDLPTVAVTLSQPGATPAQLESEVARKVENSLASLTGLKHIRTTITDGTVTILVEFVLEKKLSDALIETKDAVDKVRSDLPMDLLQPSVSGVLTGGIALMTYAVASDKLDEEALSWHIDDGLARVMQGVPGVGKFERIGGVQREVRVEVDPVKLAAHRVSATDVSRALRQVQQDFSGGRTQLGQMEQAVRTVGNVQSAEQLAALPLALPDGRQIRLDQVASVHDGRADPSQAALLNGKPVVGFKIFRSKGFDETRIFAEVKARAKQLQEQDPSLSLTLISSTVPHTIDQYKGSMSMLYEGAILAVLVVWLFLRDWRATLVAASALPLSILPAFAAMALFGFSLNTLTLLSLAVVVGILVDDAIVEVENIERHARMGKPMEQAAGDAVTEIALAVMATTMALVVVFAPTALMDGIPGLFFRQFGWTAVVAVLASLLVARLLTPLLAVHLLKPHANPGDIPDGKIMLTYMRWVRGCMKYKKTTLLTATLFLLGSLALVPYIPSALLPPSDEGTTLVNLELPTGSRLQDTVAVAEAVRQQLMSGPGRIASIASVFVSVGAGQSQGRQGTAAGEVRKGSLTIKLVPHGQRPKQVVVEREIRQQLLAVPGARFSIGNAAGGPGQSMALILTSNDTQLLLASAKAFELQLRNVAGISSIRSSASLERPELVIRPDYTRAAERGIQTAAIGSLIRIATSGDFDSQLARLNLDKRQVFIRVSLPEAIRADLAALGNLRLAGRDGLVPLASIASLDVESGPAQIDRYDRQRYVTIQADLASIPLGEALKAARALPAVQNLPAAVKLGESGSAEILAELQSGFAIAIVTAIIAVYCVLVLLFKDFVQPITILSALPLSLGGAFVALLAANSEFDLASLIGIVMLMGIVSKNSILLVEYAMVGMQQRGMPMAEAMLDACHKRARPIVMTTVAMIAGMLPLSLGLGADGSFRQPMGVAVIGGLISSTALSLLVVPVVFAVVHQLEYGVRGWFGRKLGAGARVGASGVPGQPPH